MTTIAYRNGFMAADSGVTSGSGLKIGNTMKMVQTESGILCGVAGDLHLCDVFQRFIMILDNAVGLRSRSIEAPVAGQEVNALVVFPDGYLLEIDEGRPVLDDPHEPVGGLRAVGSGWPYAMAAMRAGADAAMAVHIAASLDPKTWGPIYTWKHGSPEPRRVSF